MESTASFGYWLRRRRKALDLTQAVLANQAGCALGTLKKIETDERRPSRQLAERLANCLAIPAAERAAFVRVARAGLATDQLAMITLPIELKDAHAAPLDENVRSNNLPAQPNALIGRKHEIAGICALLRGDTVRLLTLTGPGGTGKTRLAIQAAALLDAFADGIWFINLAPIHDPALVLPTIAHLLGVIEIGGQPSKERLHAYLRARQLLLLLDNFEQVIDAALQIAELLAAAPGLKVLVTSRAALRIYGEHEYVVPQLALPPTANDERRTMGDHVADQRAVISQYESVRLFIARARAAKADFTITNTNAPAVAAICHRLDGLPLAIELAAARIKMFAPEALLIRLAQPLTLLVGGPRDLPARQQTLRNTIEWSYNLLDEDEQALFRRLGVFVGGCTLTAAEFINDQQRTENDEPAEEIDSAAPFVVHPSSLDLLVALMDKSLLRREEDRDGEPRFVMLETIREYALEQLETSGEAAELGRRHMAYYCMLAEQAEPELYGPVQRVWLDRLEGEIDNFRAAIQWALNQNAIEIGARLSVALGRFWEWRDHVPEGIRWLDAVLRQGVLLKPALFAGALHTAGGLYFRQDSSLAYIQAKTYFTESLGILVTLDDQHGIARVRADLGWLYAWSFGDKAQATAMLDETLALCRALGEKRAIAWVLHGLGWVAHKRRNLALARTYYTESLALHRELGDLARIAWSLNNLGFLAFDEGLYVEARVLHMERLSVEQALNHKTGIAGAHGALGMIALARGDVDKAAEYFAQSLEQFRKVGHTSSIAGNLADLGITAMRHGHAECAVAYYQESLMLWRELEHIYGVTDTLFLLGEVSEQQGDDTVARTHYEESLALSEKMGNWLSRRLCLLSLGTMAQRQGDAARATELVAESLRLAHARDDRSTISLCLVILSTMCQEPERQARLASAAEAALETVHGEARLRPADRSPYDHALRSVRSNLGDAAFAAAWAAGQALTLEQAIAEALSH